jgi:hypothetical protein
LITGVVHAFYILLLAHSYRIGDLTLVYPISRGSSVAFVSIFSPLIVPHYTVSALGVVGIVIVIIGLLIMGIRSRELHFSLKPLHKEKMLIPVANSSSGDLDPTVNIIDTRANKSSKRSASISSTTTTTGSSTTTTSDNSSQKNLLVAVAFALAVGLCTTVYSIDDSVGVGGTACFCNHFAYFFVSFSGSDTNSCRSTAVHPRNVFRCIPLHHALHAVGRIT